MRFTCWEEGLFAACFIFLFSLSFSLSVVLLFFFASSRLFSVQWRVPIHVFPYSFALSESVSVVKYLLLRFSLMSLVGSFLATW